MTFFFLRIALTVLLVAAWACLVDGAHASGKTHPQLYTYINIYVDTRTQCLNSRLKEGHLVYLFHGKKTKLHNTVQKIVFKEIKDTLSLKFKAEFSTEID